LSSLGTHLKYPRILQTIWMMPPILARCKRSLADERPFLRTPRLTNESVKNSTR
jgi:hypothetical protein